MNRVIVLDTGILGKLAQPVDSKESGECKQWAKQLVVNGDVLAIPEIIDYELRRELLRRQALAALRLLDGLVRQHRYIPLDTVTMHQAAVLWAWARGQGHVTAGPESLDA